MAQVENRMVTKVKVKDGDISISYDQPHGESDMLSVTVESQDEPKASFFAALRALAPHAVTMCEIQDDWLEGVTVQSVTVKHTNDGIGAVISVLKELENGKVCCLNSPYLPENVADGPQLDDTTVRAIEKLLREALAYVDGKRAQGSLFDGEKNENAA